MEINPGMRRELRLLRRSRIAARKPQDMPAGLFPILLKLCGELQLLTRFLFSAHAGEREPQIIVSLLQGRVLAYGLLQMRNRFRIVFLLEFHFSERRQSIGIIRLTLENFIEGHRCLVIISQIQIHEAELIIRFGIVGIERDRPLKL